MKKNGKLKWVIIVIAVIVVFGALAGGTDGGDDTKEAQTTSTEAKDTKDKKEKADKKDTKKEEVAENTAAESEEEKIPTEYKSALISAENYSDVMFMSKKEFMISLYLSMEINFPQKQPSMQSII